MAKRADNPDAQDLGTLLATIGRDARGLLAQQIELFRAELGQELRRAGGAAASVAGGAGLTAAGGLVGGFALAHLLNRVTGLPLWACLGLVGGGLGAAGVKLLLAGKDGFAGLKPLPQTTEALGENLEWLKDRLTPAAG